MSVDQAPAILFVCLGNICRSPTAEAVMRALAPGWRLDSAGTGGWHVGAPPHPPMIRAAAAAGYDLTPLRARQVAREDFDAFDHILAMDRSNLADLAALAPPGARARLGLLLDHAPGSGARDVPDPYYTSDFAGALALIEAGCRGFRDSLASGGPGR